VIEVTDDGSGRHHSTVPGRRLVGMRERVALYSGTLTAGPRAGSAGWRVRAALPLVRVSA